MSNRGERVGRHCGERARDARELRKAIVARGLVPGSESWANAWRAGLETMQEVARRREAERQAPSDVPVS
jgi:hypothetical protein